MTRGLHRSWWSPEFRRHSRPQSLSTTPISATTASAEVVPEARSRRLDASPELREEGSLERYFVARLGRERGYYGVELTTFVEQAYESGLAKFAIEAGMAAGPRQVAA